MNAANYQAFRDFRKHVDIKQKLKRGGNKCRIYLPKEGFTYGMPNRPPTPIKDIINNNYGNIAEIRIKNEYKNFIKKMRSQSNTNINVKLSLMRKMIEEKRKKYIERRKDKMGLGHWEKHEINVSTQNKPLYKLKMFSNVRSKVAEGLKMFKSFKPPKQKVKINNKCEIDCANENNNIDNMINKDQAEMKQKEEEKNKLEALPTI